MVNPLVADAPGNAHNTDAIDVSGRHQDRDESNGTTMVAPVSHTGTYRGPMQGKGMVLSC